MKNQIEEGNEAVESLPADEYGAGIYEEEVMATAVNGASVHSELFRSGDLIGIIDA